MAEKRFEWEPWVVGTVAITLVAVIVGTYFYDRERFTKKTEVAQEDFSEFKAVEVASAVDDHSTESRSLAPSSPQAKASQDFSLLLSVTPPARPSVEDQYSAQPWARCVSSIVEKIKGYLAFDRSLGEMRTLEISELLKEPTKYGHEYTLHAEGMRAGRDPMRLGDAYSYDFVCHVARKGQVLSIRDVTL